MAFVLLPVASSSSNADDISRGLGFEGSVGSLAVEFDIFQDTSVDDPDGNHIRVDVGGSVKSLFTASPGFDLRDPSSARSAWVEYADGRLKVYVSSTQAAQGQRPSVPVLDVSLPLCNFLLPATSQGHSSFWVGFTAASGSADVAVFKSLEWVFTASEWCATTPGLVMEWVNGRLAWSEGGEQCRQLEWHSLCFLQWMVTQRGSLDRRRRFMD